MTLLFLIAYLIIGVILSSLFVGYQKHKDRWFDKGYSTIKTPYMYNVMVTIAMIPFWYIVIPLLLIIIMAKKISLSFENYLNKVKD